MSAKKLNLPNSVPYNSLTQKTRLSLAASAVHIRKSGIEFKTVTPIHAWTELSIDLEYPDRGNVHCSGVVVACDGNRHAGYLVSFLFTKLSRQSEAVLGALTSHVQN